jgi:hypothetical protein
MAKPAVGTQIIQPAQSHGRYAASNKFFDILKILTFGVSI